MRTSIELQKGIIDEPEQVIRSPHHSYRAIRLIVVFPETLVHLKTPPSDPTQLKWQAGLELEILIDIQEFSGRRYINQPSKDA